MGLEGREEQTALGVRQREACLLPGLPTQVLLGLRHPVSYIWCVQSVFGAWSQYTNQCHKTGPLHRVFRIRSIIIRLGLCPHERQLVSGLYSSVFQFDTEWNFVHQLICVASVCSVNSFL